MNDGTEALSFWTLRKARSSPLGPGVREEAPRIAINIANLLEFAAAAVLDRRSRERRFAKRVCEPPTAAATAAWSRADRFGPALEHGHKAWLADQDTAQRGFGRSIGRPWGRHDDRGSPRCRRAHRPAWKARSSILQCRSALPRLWWSPTKESYQFLDRSENYSALNLVTSAASESRNSTNGSRSAFTISRSLHQAGWDWPG